MNSVANLPVEQGRAWSWPKIDARWKRWLVVVVYAAAMAWVEAAVVFYIRFHIDRLVPYQPEPLPLAGGFGFAEVVREFATMVMLATVGWLAGNTRRTRIAFALLAFGIWDIAYYIWLMPLTGWPRAISDWDVLFLIPLPWWGPVWAPVSIALLMVSFGTVVCAFDSSSKPLVPSGASCLLAFAGAVLAVYVFIADSLQVVVANHSLNGLRSMLPQSFNRILFGLSFLLLAAPLISVIRLWLGAREAVQLDCGKWINHFTRNRANRPEPDWLAPMTLSPAHLKSVLPSIEQFQLGDGGGECRLIAFNAERFRGQSDELRQLVDLWFAEEAEHARLLGCLVDRLGGHRIKSHWSFSAFCQVRRLLGVRFELQVLTLTELVSTAYYRVLLRYVNDLPAREVCSLILRDEAGHVAFHRERLAVISRHYRGPGALFWAMQFWLCGYAAATVLWSSHGPCLAPLGATSREYFREVRREIGRFSKRMFALRRRSHARAEDAASYEVSTPVFYAAR